MQLKNAIRLAAITSIVFAAGCGTTKEAKKSTLPSITTDNVPFIRITSFACMDLLSSAKRGKVTPTREVVESEIKRQRVFGTEALQKGDLYIPGLRDDNEPKSIVTVDSGVEEWALIETALWDEKRNDAVVTYGFIPAYEYKHYLARKAAQSK
jgi:hypothetical protein